jgi:pimeloyl-ACP methyl ester carboxylesterase
LVVPVDYDDPNGPTMSLAVARWPALSTAERIGVLVYGPGAGGSGVLEPQQLVSWLNPVAAEALRRFDIVGVDIRGTAASTPLIDCVNDATRSSLLSQLRSAADDAAVAVVRRYFVTNGDVVLATDGRIEAL